MPNTQANNLMLLDAAGFPRTIDTDPTNGDELQIDVPVNFGSEVSTSGDLLVGGDLQVSGDIISSGVIDVVTSDNFLDLNMGNTGLRGSGFTTQVDNQKAVSIPLDRGEFIAKTSTDDAKLVLVGDFTQGGALGLKLVELDAVATIKASGAILELSDGMGTKQYALQAGAPTPGTNQIDVTAAVDQETLCQEVVAGLQGFAGTDFALALTYSHQAGETKFGIEPVGFGQNFDAIIAGAVIAVENDSANVLFGQNPDVQLEVVDNATIANDQRILFTDGTNALPQLSVNVDWTIGANAQATIVNIRNAVIAAIRKQNFGAPFFNARVASSPTDPFVKVVLLTGKEQTGAKVTVSGSALSAFNVDQASGDLDFTSGADFLYIGDIVAIGALTDLAENNGLFAVSRAPVYTVATNSTEIEFAASNVKGHDFLQNDFEAGTVAQGDPGNLFAGISLSVLAVSDGGYLMVDSGPDIPLGDWCQAWCEAYPQAIGIGNANPGRSKVRYEAFGNVSLQEAYEVGSTIDMDAINGSVQFGVNSESFLVNPSLGSANHLIEANSSALNLASDGSTGGPAVAVKLGNPNATTLGIISSTSATMSSAIVDIEGSTSIDLDSAGAITLDAEEAFGISGDSLVIAADGLGASASGDLTIDSAGDMELNAAGTSTLSIANDSLTGAVNIASAGARTLTIGASTATDMNLFGDTFDGVFQSAANLTADGITLEATSGALDVDADAGFDILGGDGATGTAAGSLRSDSTLTIASIAADLDIDAQTSIAINSAAGSITGTAVGGGIVLSGTEDSQLVAAAPLAATADVTLSLSASNASAFEGKILLSADEFVVSSETIFGEENLATDASRKPVGVNFVCGEEFDAGDALCLNTDDNKVFKVDAGAAAIVGRHFIGFAVDGADAAAVAAGDAKLVATVPGTIALASFKVGPTNSADVGKQVYVFDSDGAGADEGKVILTAPQNTDCTIFQVGILASSTAVGGLYPVLLMPQFIAKRP